MSSNKRKVGGSAAGAAKARALLSSYIRKGKEIRDQLSDTEEEDEDDGDVYLTMKDIEELEPDYVKEEEPEAKPAEEEAEAKPVEIKPVVKVEEQKEDPKYTEMSKSIFDLTNMVKQLQSTPQPSYVSQVEKVKSFRQVQDDALRDKLRASFFN